MKHLVFMLVLGLPLPVWKVNNILRLLSPARNWRYWNAPPPSVCWGTKDSWLHVAVPWMPWLKNSILVYRRFRFRFKNFEQHSLGLPVCRKVVVKHSINQNPCQLIALFYFLETLEVCAPCHGGGGGGETWFTAHVSYTIWSCAPFNEVQLFKLIWPLMTCLQANW